MYLKQGVSLKLLQACMFPAMIVCIDYFDSINKDFTITSGDDSKHLTNSKHYIGLAFDVRSRELSDIEKFNFRIYFTERLDNCFYFLQESDHFHIQYDESVSETPWP